MHKHNTHTNIYTHRLVNARVSPILLSPILEPGLVLGFDFGLEHMIDARVALDTSPHGILGSEITVR